MLFFLFLRDKGKINNKDTVYWWYQNRKCASSNTTKSEFGSLNKVIHSCDSSKIEHKCKEVEETFFYRSTQELTSISRIYEEEEAKLIECRFSHEYGAAFLNSKKTTFYKKAYRAKVAVQSEKRNTKKINNEY